MTVCYIDYLSSSQTTITRVIFGLSGEMMTGVKMLVSQTQPIHHLLDWGLSVHHYGFAGLVILCLGAALCVVEH